MNPNHYPQYNSPKEEDRPFYLESYDDDELGAYGLYLEERGLDDTEESALKFDGDYWGVYNSIDEFTQNWCYHAEPNDAVQTLLSKYPELEDKISLAELALLDRLSGSMEFHFEGGQVTIFNREEPEEWS